MKVLIDSFYTAFKEKDAEKMIACYHGEVSFIDPVFGELKADDARDMWRMLCQNANNLEIEYSSINASVKKGSVHWEARYTFSKTGKKIHNIVEASFEFKDSKIIKHTDNFNFHKWAAQAFGWKGWLFGGTDFFKNKIRLGSHKALMEFKQKNKLL